MKKKKYKIIEEVEQKRVKERDDIEEINKAEKSREPKISKDMLLGKEPINLGVIKLGKTENKENGETKEGRGYKEPVTMYIREGGEVEIIEDCHSGILTVKGSDNEEKFHLLDPNKLLEIPTVGGLIKGWIIDENSALPYPRDAVYDSGVFNNILLRLVDDNKGLSEGMAGAMKIRSIGTVILILVIAIIGIASSWSMIEPMIKSLFGG